MWAQLFVRRSAVARQLAAPYLEERRRYLAFCAERGDTPATLVQKARILLWVARALSGPPGLNVTLEEFRAAAASGRGRATMAMSRWSTRGFLMVGQAWLRYLGYLRPPVAPMPFRPHLDAFCQWAAHERGLQPTTIDLRRRTIAQFLRWYGARGRALAVLQVADVDAYLALGNAQDWSRAFRHSVADSLRAFLRYGAAQGWAPPTVASTIQSPRLYALAGLPAGPPWAEVQRLLAAADTAHPTDVRDRAILLLFAIYGLRESEVAHLRLEDLDWAHDRLRVSRVKRRTAQTYPLVSSVGNAILRYLEEVRRPSAHREVFLTLCSPRRPLTRTALYSIVARRLTALGVRTAHVGPHALRHACAARLVAAGLSLKAIGDHLGHRSSAATRIYAKVDLAGLREVAAFDLGDLR